MSQRKETKEYVPERNYSVSHGRALCENSLEQRDRNSFHKSEPNLKVKATMARELCSMGLEIEAIGTILGTDTTMVEEWLSIGNLEVESR